MGLKTFLKTLDGLSDTDKAFYSATGEGDDAGFEIDLTKYVAAQVETATAGLKAKNDELLGESKAAKAKAKAEADAAAAAALEAAKKGGDVEALEKSWQAKYDKLIADHKTETEGDRKTIQDLTVGSAAKSISAELAVEGSASVLEKYIAPRLGYDVKDGKATVVVRDDQGRPTALTLDEFKAEISSDKALAPLIAASKASGGGAANANGGAGSPKTYTRAEYDAMSPVEQRKVSTQEGVTFTD